MKVDFGSLDFYINDNTIFVVPEISILSKLDYSEYLQKYTKLGEQLINLPIKLNKGSSYGNENGWIKSKLNHYNESNNLISSIVGYECFKIHVNEIDDYIEIPLGLLVLSDLINCDDFDWYDFDYNPLSIFVKGYIISIKPKQNDISAPFASKLINGLFTSKHGYRYEDTQGFCKDYVKQIHLYNQLKLSGERSIIISDYVDNPFSTDRDELQGKRVFTKDRHESFTKKDLTILSEIEYYKDTNIDLSWKYLGELFEYQFLEIPFLNLGYVLFNEFILGNKCYGLFMDFGAIPNRGFIKDGDREYNKDYSSFEIADSPRIYVDNAIIDKRVLQVCFDYNQFAKVVNPVTPYIYNQVNEFIETIKGVKELREEFFKSNMIIENQLEEVCEEILNISEFADKAQITIDLGEKKLKGMISSFTSNDLNKLGHIRNKIQGYGFVAPDEHSHKQTKLSGVKRRKLK